MVFSSVAALLGAPGQANYAAANAAVDRLAAAARSTGIAGFSIQWGAWAGGGMAVQDAGTAARIGRLGMAMLTPQQGLAALQGILAQSSTASSASATLAAVPFSWERFLQRVAPSDTTFEEFRQSSTPPLSSSTPGELVVFKSEDANIENKVSAVL